MCVSAKRNSDDGRVSNRGDMSKLKCLIDERNDREKNNKRKNEIKSNSESYMRNRNHLKMKSKKTRKIKNNVNNIDILQVKREMSAIGISSRSIYNSLFRCITFRSTLMSESTVNESQHTTECERTHVNDAHISSPASDLCPRQQQQHYKYGSDELNRYRFRLFCLALLSSKRAIN